MQLPDAKSVMYTACVLQKYSQTNLLAAVQKWMFETTGSGIQKGWITRAHHMTVKFNPRQSDIEAVRNFLGQEVELQITDWAVDDYGIACVVKSKVALPLANEVPHITIAHSRNVGAVYSNTLLADRSKWNPVEVPISVNSEMVCVLRDNMTMIPQPVNAAAQTVSNF